MVKASAQAQKSGNELLAESDTPALAVSVAEPPCDWGVAYWMSYDNDLETFGKQIISEIRSGIISANTVAAVQADFTDPGGMYRIVIQSTGMTQTRLTSDDSANEDQVIDYLNWFVKTFPCKHYIVTFLDHGGGLDEMSRDDHPDTPGKFWLSGQVMGEKLRAFAQTVPGKWELLFLQQCGRGSLENLYSFRGTANFIMSSPTPLFPPNSYYTAFHRWLSQSPGTDGKAIAAKIAQFDVGYTMYTCLRTRALDELPGRFNLVLLSFLGTEHLDPPWGLVGVYSSNGESLMDAKSYLDRLSASNRLDASAVVSFFTWVNQELFVGTWLQPQRESSAGPLCGLTLYAAWSYPQVDRYARLDFYQKTRLSQLWTKLFPVDSRKGGN